MKAGELLRTFKIRQGMQNDGTTNPSDNIKRVTSSLVEELSKLDENEVIEVVISNREKHHTQYILKSTGRVLVEKRGN